MRVLPPILLAAALVACRREGSTSPPAAVVDAATNSSPTPVTVTVRPGEVAGYGGAALRVTFLGVEGDSRCPRDVACAWAGDAGVRLRLTRGQTNAEPTLHTTLEPRRVEFDWS